MTQLTLNLQGDTEATGGTMTSSSQVASRNYANHSAPLEKEKGRMMNATYGERCFEQFKKLSPNSSSLKMYLVSRILMADWYSSRCALTWKMKGTKFSRLLFQLVPKTLRTEETDAGLLLKTPCSADAYTENLTKKEQRFGNSGTLAQEVQTGFVYQRGILPTPNAYDYKSGVKQDTYQRRKARHLKKGVNLQYPLKQMAADIENPSGKISQLNPRFVAEMMGFPPHWTELPFQSGENNQSKDTETP